jgi:hypothetical protein
LAGHLPERFGAGSGFIIDHNDAVSKQNDVIVYDAHKCPVYRASNDAAIIPSEYVAVVIDVKALLNEDKLRPPRISPPQNRWQTARRPMVGQPRRLGAFLPSRVRLA